MKKTTFILTLCLVLFFFLPGCQEETGKPYTSICMNVPFKFDGCSFTVTAVTVAESYLAPDGTTHSQNDDDMLAIVRCKAELMSEWHASNMFLVLSHYSEYAQEDSIGKLLCDPIPESSSNGEDALIYLFSIPKEGYSGNIQDYYLNINFVSSEGPNTLQTFNFYDYLEYIEKLQK